ncbi:hypothetical protein DXV75_16355, partial [Alteromonas aestuariivivens]
MREAHSFFRMKPDGLGFHQGVVQFYCAYTKKAHSFEWASSYNWESGGVLLSHGGEERCFAEAWRMPNGIRQVMNDSRSATGWG